jgi:hypothetical protein
VFPRLVIRLAAGALLLALAVDVTRGDAVASLTVINQTDHYVHAILDGKPFLYVPPGAGATLEKEGRSTVVARVFYAPAQGISGSTERTFVIAPFEPGSTGCDWVGGSCETTSPTGGPVSWTVTTDSLRVTP